MATLTIADLDNGKRDLKTVSEVANSRSATTTTRLGGQTTTLYEAIRRISADGEAQLDEQKTAAEEVIRSLGFRVPVGYAPGLDVTDSRFTVTGPDGKVYAPLSAPFTAGAWDPTQWYVLQNDLNDNKLLVFNSYVAASAAAATLPDGHVLLIKSDENHYSLPSEYRVQSGGLVFLGITREGRADESLPIIFSANNADIQAGFVSASNGTYKVRPGEYAGDFDLIISGKNAASLGVTGALTIDMTGVRFTGTGKIVVDGCKRVELIGFDAPNFDYCFRGAWWITTRKARFRKQIFGDALGTDFQSNYWSDWQNCQFQTIEVGEFATYSNKMDWYSCSMRGNAGQGFTGTANYAFEFNGNSNAQGWCFWGGDVSYHNIDVYGVGASNTGGDIELTFDGTYFDTHYPRPISRARSRVQTKNCHSANNFAAGSYLSAVARGGQDSFRQDRSCAWAQSTGINFVPNGDLRVGLSTWTGAGAPLGALGGATLTEVAGGLYGRALRLTQAGTSGAVRFRPRALPVRGRYSCSLVLKNGEVGTRTIRVGFNSLYDVVTIKDAEPTYWTLTTGEDIEVGAQPDIQILTNDATPFVVDVLFAGVTFGEGGPAFAPAPAPTQISFSSGSFYNPPSLASGQSVTTTLTVSGAAIGDFVQPSFSQALQGLTLTASVSSAGSVDFTFSNYTGSTVDLAAGTLRCLITKSAW